MAKDLILTSALILSFPKWQSVKRTGCCDHYGSQVKMLFIGCSLFPSGTFVPHKGYTLVMLPWVPLVKLCCYGYRWASPKNNSNIRSTYQSFFHHTSSLVQVFCCILLRDWIQKIMTSSNTNTLRNMLSWQAVLFVVGSSLLLLRIKNTQDITSAIYLIRPIPYF